MSIWFELMALSLAAYAVGLLLGWILWSDSGHTPADETAQSESEASESRTPQDTTQ